MVCLSYPLLKGPSLALGDFSEFLIGRGSTGIAVIVLARLQVSRNFASFHAEVAFLCMGYS